MGSAGSAPQRRPRAVGFLLGCLIGTAIAVLLVRHSVPPTDIQVTTLLLFPALALAVTAHEAGHAITVLALGGRIREVRVGSGWRLTPGSWRLDLRLLPLRGHVRAEPFTGDHARARQSLVTGAGITVNLAVAAGAALVPGAPWTDWRIAVVVVNGFFGMTNLVPAEVQRGTGRKTDGLQLWLLLRKRSDLLPLDVGRRMNAFVASSRGRDVAATEQDLGRLLPHWVGPTRTLVVDDALRREEWMTAARLAWGPDRASCIDPHRFARAVATMLVLGHQLRPEYLQAAEHAAAQALSELSADATAADRAARNLTLGLVRLAQGDVGEALRLTHDLAPLVPARDAGTAAAAFGLAVLGVGKTEQAGHVLTLLERMGAADTPLARRLAELLGDPDQLEASALSRVPPASSAASAATAAGPSEP